MNIFEEAIQTRRKFHSRPEEGWTEFETSYLVADRLKTLGCKSRRSCRVFGKNKRLHRRYRNI